jgi:hypothetical protein
MVWVKDLKLEDFHQTFARTQFVIRIKIPLLSWQHPSSMLSGLISALATMDKGVYYKSVLPSMVGLECRCYGSGSANCCWQEGSDIENATLGH